MKQREAFGRLAFYTASFVCVCVLQQKFDHSSRYLVAISFVLSFSIWFLPVLLLMIRFWVVLGCNSHESWSVCVCVSLLLVCLLLRWVVCCISESVHIV